MEKQLQLVVSPQCAANNDELKTFISRELSIQPGDISWFRVTRRSIDARKRDIKVNLSVLVGINEPLPNAKAVEFLYPGVHAKPVVIVVGAGPAGLFAALRLIELGYKPMVLERGKDVKSRKRDIALITREQIINPESNYCFGEGGAGTFSDGKLYTRSKKRGDMDRVLQVFHAHGAPEDILYDAHPHIGTDKLPGIITRMRETIENAGGEILFNTRVDDLIIEAHRLKGVVTNAGDRLMANAVLLATGHSARDIYQLLHRRGILLEAKSFAMGVRVEHPQELIDDIQYHKQLRGDYLPAATYSLVTQIEGRGVYSFCMCPGGFIVPSATAPNEIVVNGMSPASRNSPFANSGIVVEIRLEDVPGLEEHGPLAGLVYQEQLEKMARLNGGLGQAAPAQRLTDFVKGRISQSLPGYSYTPGLVVSPMHFWLPDVISSRLRKGFEDFNRKMRGFITEEAIVVGVESRTSSPVRIPRSVDSFMHPGLEGLFPCGEGAGYAGGIVSSAIDGENAASKLAEWIR